MKRALLALLLLSAVIFQTSCSGGEELNLIPVKADKDYQFIDRTGKIVINPQFKHVSIFREGLALVCPSGEAVKYGFIDEEGKYVINANYIQATVFSDGLAWVVAENGSPTAINKKGEIKLTLQNAEQARIFKDGLAAFSVVDSSGEKWGFVNKEGKVVINPQFDFVSNFSSGKVAVLSNEKWGYVDEEGKILINPQFDYAGDFIGDMAAVKNGDKYGAINTEGKYIVNPQFDDIKIDGDLLMVQQDNKWGWSNNEGKIIINPQFEVSFAFGDANITAVKSGKQYGYIDKEGKYVINPQFDYAKSFFGDLALIKNGNKIGFIDAEGKYVINPQYEDVPDDFDDYIWDKGTSFDHVRTDFFNLTAITDRVKKDITSTAICGMDFSTPLSSIMTKYNKTQSDFYQYSSQTALILNEKLTSDASHSLYYQGSAYSYDPYSGTTYFDATSVPSGFYYQIQLSGRGFRKQDQLFESILSSLSGGFTKDEYYSSTNSVTLTSPTLVLRIENYSTYINIRVTPNRSTPSSYAPPAAEIPIPAAPDEIPASAPASPY